MDYAALLLLIAVLYVRPSEIFVAVAGMQIYLVCMIIAATLASLSIARQLSPREFTARPLTFCAFGMMVAALLSNLANGYLGEIRGCLNDFIRLVFLYLIVAGTLSTPGRLEKFLLWIVLCVAILTTICLADFSGAYEFPLVNSVLLDGGLDSDTAVYRLQATGIFNNPNGFSRILAAAILLTLYWLMHPSYRLLAPVWLGLLGLFGHALLQTRSRGGLIALLGGLAVLFAAKFGLKRAIILGVLAFPVLMAVAGGGRQTELSTAEGTGQQRVQLWEGGLTLFLRRPIFGIGMNQYVENFKLVAHNSFVHAYVELGIFGGIFFVGGYYFGITGLLAVGRFKDQIAVAKLVRIRPFLLALLGADVAGMMSISLSYAPTTFVTWGMVTAYHRVVEQYAGVSTRRIDGKAIRDMILVGICGLVFIYVFVKINVRYKS